MYSVIGNTFNKPDATIEDDQFQLPDLRNVFLRGCPEYIENSEENRLVGNFQACGVPNSNGIFYSVHGVSSAPNFTGPFSSISMESNYCGYGQYYGYLMASFDLSRSSPVYQDNLTEVRPDNITINYIIKL